MKTKRSLIRAATAMTLSLAAASTMACKDGTKAGADTDAPHSSSTAASAAAAPAVGAQTGMADGVVRKIDRDNKKITLKHGEIANLQMPGMTMVFLVKEVSLLDKVKAGDKVKFHAEKQEGVIVITHVEAQ